jgi:hypothetical protein
MFRRVWNFLDRIGWVVAIGFVAIGFNTLHSQGSSLRTLVNERHTASVERNNENAAHALNASVNRAVNVESWCSGINAINDYDRLIIRRTTSGALTYTLPDLPCEEIIQDTLQSATERAVVTHETHRLVYEALSPKLRKLYEPSARVYHGQTNLSSSGG